MMNIKKIAILSVILFQSACSSNFRNTATNVSLKNLQANSTLSNTLMKPNDIIVANNKSKASMIVDDLRDQNDDILVILALSGGGSRAAYLSATTMLKLQEMEIASGRSLLDEVDIISSVSGGSMAAAYYGVSVDCDEENNATESDIAQAWRRCWNKQSVTNHFSKNYTARWAFNFLWPFNFIRYYTTNYDRTDLMAQTLADNLYDLPIASVRLELPKRAPGQDLKFSDLNPHRPNIIINATNATRNQSNRSGGYPPFRFTEEAFAGELNSDISQYSIARAVMASSAFPAVFNTNTLYNFKNEKIEYVHLFDGGAHDNLGVSVLSEIIQKNNVRKERSFEHIVIILVDAHNTVSGVSKHKADGRGLLSYLFLVDTNVIDSIDALMNENRQAKIRSISEAMAHNNYSSDAFTFWHVTFDTIPRLTDGDIKLANAVENIKTDFNLKDKEPGYIDEALDRILEEDASCIESIKALFYVGGVNDAEKISHNGPIGVDRCDN